MELNIFIDGFEKILHFFIIKNAKIYLWDLLHCQIGKQMTVKDTLSDFFIMGKTKKI